MSTNILNRPEKVILGVCKQLALLTKIELVIVRIVFIIAACLSGVGIGVYLILYFVLINLKETNNNLVYYQSILGLKISMFHQVIALLYYISKPG